VSALVAIRARPRLLLSTGLAILVYLAVPADLPQQTRGVIGWDVGIAVFLATALTMMLRSSIERLRRRAEEDEGRTVILTLTVVAVAISLFAIGFEIHDAKGQPPAAAAWRVALAMVTVVLSWTFTHTMFAMHYAHEFYRAKKPTGLLFPGDAPPDYLDFLYYAFVVGMTCQVSDVQVAGRTLRRLTLAHGVLSFFFNTGILALAINLAAGLF
jgi:uncharacterized membrane protein